MKKLAINILLLIKEIIDKDISLEKVSEYEDLVYILNVVAIECCGVEPTDEYPLISLSKNRCTLPTLLEVERVIIKLF